MKYVLSIIAPVLVASPSAFAATLTCRAEMVHSVCGTGEIEFVLEMNVATGNSFKIKNGDVPCWYMPYDISGESLTQGKTYPYFVSSYELLVVDTITQTKSTYGFFHYDEMKKKARLTINTSSPSILSTKYDLDCELTKEQI